MDPLKDAEKVDTHFTENPEMKQAIKKIKNKVKEVQTIRDGNTDFGDGRNRSHSQGKCGLLRAGCPICKIEQSKKALQSNFIVNFIENEDGLDMKKFDHIAYLGITQGQAGILGKTEHFLKTNFQIYPAHHGIYYGNNKVIEISENRDGPGSSVEEHDFMDLNFDSIELKKQENGFLDSTKCSFVDKCMANQSPLVKIHYASEDLLNRSECKTELSTCEPNTPHSICACCFNEECQERRYRYIKYYESVEGHDYSLFTKNCENFATFVKTGKSYTTQIKSITNVLSTGFYNVLAINFGIPPYWGNYSIGQWVTENVGNIFNRFFPPCTYEMSKRGGHKRKKHKKKRKTRRKTRRKKKRKTRRKKKRKTIRKRK